MEILFDFQRISPTRSVVKLWWFKLMMMYDTNSTWIMQETHHRKLARVKSRDNYKWREIRQKFPFFAATAIILPSTKNCGKKYFKKFSRENLFIGAFP